MDKYSDMEMKVCRMVLSEFGLWPSKKDISLKNYLRFTVIIIITLGFCNIPQTVSLFQSSGNVDEMLEITTNCDLTTTLAVVKMLTIWFNRKALSKLLAAIAEDWKNVKVQAERLIMEKNAKISYLTSIILFSLCEAAVFALLVLNSYYRMKESQTFMENNEVNASERIRPLYLLSKFPYDVQKTPYYEITWICQYLTTLFGGSGFAAVDCFFTALVLHLCAQMKILRMQLKDLLMQAAFKRKNSYGNLDLSQIVKRHQHLLWYAESIENIFNQQFLIMLLSSVLIFCLTGYQIVVILKQEVISAFEMTFAAYYYLSFAASLFVYCFIAMTLSTESMKLGETAYHSDWYHLSSSDAKLLILIIIRTSRPVELTAGKFVAFSLQLYCSVMKTSGGYLSVLLAMRDT